MSTDFPYGKFNPMEAFNNARSQNISYADFVNPLMTSMKCLSSKFSGSLRINGTDIMDRNAEINPDFFNHNHVIIPYCSSDLWLGEESNSGECNCSDLACFGYQPNSPNLQFTFRGKLIFESIFRQLQIEHGMNNADEVVIAGSSAGGVGVLNHAKWVRNQVLPSTKLLVLFDSSWFIDFQESIYRVFDGTLNSANSMMLNISTHLLGILSSNPACSDIVLGYPCCISAHCILSRRNRTELAYYPETNQRTFAIFSLYDIFLLAPALAGKDSFATSSVSSNLVGELINFLRIIGEYGGAMNITASMSYNKVCCVMQITSEVL